MKTGPFEIQSLICPNFKCFLILNGLILCGSEYWPFKYQKHSNTWYFEVPVVKTIWKLDKLSDFRMVCIDYSSHKIVLLNSLSLLNFLFVSCICEWSGCPIFKWHLKTRPFGVQTGLARGQQRSLVAHCLSVSGELGSNTCGGEKNSSFLFELWLLRINSWLCKGIN